DTSIEKTSEGLAPEQTSDNEITFDSFSFKNVADEVTATSPGIMPKNSDIDSNEFEEDNEPIVKDLDPDFSEELEMDFWEETADNYDDEPDVTDETEDNFVANVYEDATTSEDVTEEDTALDEEVAEEDTTEEDAALDEEVAEEDTTVEDTASDEEVAEEAATEEDTTEEDAALEEEVAEEVATEEDTTIEDAASEEEVAEPEDIYVVETSINSLLRDDLKVLEQLKEVSPATYRHCEHIARICESVANEVGADAKLLYACGMYHRIGQLFDNNYVPETIEFATRMAVPKEFTAIMEEYSCSVRKPQTLEAVILMLTTSIISTMRALAKKAPGKNYDIVSIINKVFDNAIEKGRLEESRLGTPELNRLRDIFTKLFTE
ncbi:MAG: hypothetical protein K6G65_04120, partial [Lachnospiraceae bacterium]|nr:hypothetical protein [Lachnospiraceae bacterium]